MVRAGEKGQYQGLLEVTLNGEKQAENSLIPFNDKVGNDPAVKEMITAYNDEIVELYGGGAEMRLIQEIVLGIGGWRLLESLGIEVDVCHLNEGHAAFAVLERARSFMKKHGVSRLGWTMAKPQFNAAISLQELREDFLPERGYRLPPAAVLPSHLRCRCSFACGVS